MKSVLSIKDTLDAQIIGQILPVSDATCNCNGHVSGNIFCYESIWITGILCLTIILLTVSILSMILHYKRERLIELNRENKRKDDVAESVRKEKQQMEIDKEKSRYRERLANFIELQAKNKSEMATKEGTCAFNEEISSYYVAELKSYIKDLIPSDRDYVFSKKDEKHNNIES